MKLMRLPRMQQTQHIPTLLQLVIQILPIAGGGFHPDEDLAGRSIQLVQFLFPDLPALGKDDRLDYHALVGPTDAARTGLASDINPTDVLDRRFLRRGNRLRCTPHTPASPWFNSPCACRPMSLITVLSEKPDQPGRTAAHAGSAIKPMQLSFEQ